MSGQLVNFKESNLEAWKQVLASVARKHGNIHVFIDTETTGASLFDDSISQYHRVLEFSCVFTYRDGNGFCHVIKDEAGNPIIVDEPINPFLASEGQASAILTKSVNKIPADAIEVHGISVPYLFAEEEGPGPYHRPKLKHPAPSYSQVFEAFSKLMAFEGCFDDNVEVFGVFHNAPFDLGFLAQESGIIGEHPFESFFCSIDTLVAAKKILPKRCLSISTKDGRQRASYSLDRCYKAVLDMYPDVVGYVERPIHTALIDSMIMLEMFNGLNAALKDF